jgi:phage tail sheath protein FI
MAETIVSPGVLAIENDQSFVTQAPVQAGAAIIGPTVKGKVGIPTIVTTYTDYLNKFGATFLSGSNTYTYFTSIAAYNYFNNGGPSLLITRVVGENFTSATSSFISASAHSAGSPYNTSAFVLETLSEGVIMNSDGPTGNFGTLLSGSADNFRWQILNADTSSGTFNLLIRQGNDSTVSPSIVETWGPLSLDPFSADYIEKVIGNQVENVVSDNGEYYIQLSGSYPNNSTCVRVKQVNQTTPNYFDNVGNPKPQYTGSIPLNGSGSFGSAVGKNVPTGVVANYYETITTSTNIQGISASAYTESISLLANKDAFSYNLLVTPGLISNTGGVAASAISSMVSIAQNRGDMMVVFDSSKYGAQISQVLTDTIGYDTSYAATYWPWVKTVDPNTANQVWVPASTMIPGIYAFNDNVAAPWFAPAGINRGILTTSTQAERVLTQGNRDTLYQANINPIATLPTTGVVVFGQKTLQKKKSSLDRINVRRLLIELKSYISQVADTFVFEQNDTITRNNFLSVINPYLASVQQQQGLITYQVIMDESNNPPNVVDNNQLVGQIYLQPTKTVEFIVLDFNILPTGATFPA